MKGIPGRTCSAWSSVTLIAVVALVGLMRELRDASAQERSGHAAQPVERAPAPEATAGERIFAASCAVCHGLDGQGSDRGPGIAESARVQHLTDSELFNIISNGIPGTGMPAFRSLSDDDIRGVVSNLRLLQGKHEVHPLPGDARHGKEIFFGKGECSTCHTIFGAGGFLGPDLSGYGQTTSAQAILDTILSANRIVPAGYRSGAVTTRDGNRFEGVIRNEDNFSLQLQAKDGTFRFFRQSDVKSVEHPTQSLMPTNYRDRLSPDELNDLVNYLVNGNARKTARKAEEDPDEEDFK